jgi:hypothetical protein
VRVNVEELVDEADVLNDEIDAGLEVFEVEITFDLRDDELLFVTMSCCVSVGSSVASSLWVLFLVLCLPLSNVHDLVSAFVGGGGPGWL